MPIIYEQKLFKVNICISLMPEPIALYSQGTVGVREDFSLSMDIRNGNQRRRIYLVGDATSEPYWPGRPQRLFDGRTAGQVAGNTILQTLLSADPKKTLKEIITEANEKMAATWESYNLSFPGDPFELGQLSLGAPEDLGAATLAAMDIAETVKIHAIGDALALWQLRNGDYGGTASQHFKHDTQMYEEIERAYREGGDGIGEMWKIFGPRLVNFRRQRVNNKNDPYGYGVLNGQRSAVEYLQEREFHPSELTFLLLATDGMFEHPLTGDTSALARAFFERYDQLQNLENIIKERRKREDEKKGSHIYGGHAELSAILIPF